MKLIYSLLFIGLIIFTACTKDVGPNSAVIETGKVQFEINNDVSLQQSILAIKSINPPDYELNRFYYSKVIPGDSMSYYFNLFKTCSYIKVFDIFKKTGDNFTRFRSMSFKNMSELNYANWDSIVKSERLNEILNSGEEATYRNGFLYVPAGKEKEWIEKLRTLNEIKSAGYIYVNNGFD